MTSPYDLWGVVARPPSARIVSAALGGKAISSRRSQKSDSLDSLDSLGHSTTTLRTIRAANRQTNAAHSGLCTTVASCTSNSPSAQIVGCGIDRQIGAGTFSKVY